MASFHKSLCFLMAFFITFIVSTHGYTFQVGGKDGWTLHPSENYNSWSGRLRFLINDTLHFKYNGGSDSVLVVNKSDYDGCNANNPITKLDGGDSMFKFDRSGPFYFITGNKTNCDQGQKLMVVVISLKIRSPPPSVVTPPSSSPKPPSPVISPVIPPSASHVSPPSPAGGSPNISPSKSPVSPPSTHGSPKSSPYGAPTFTPPVSSPGGLTPPASSPGGLASPASSRGGLTPPASSPGGLTSPASSPGGQNAHSPDGGKANSPDGGNADSPGGESADSPANGTAGSRGGVGGRSPGSNSPGGNGSSSIRSAAAPPLCATIIASLVATKFAFRGLN